MKLELCGSVVIETGTTGTTVVRIVRPDVRAQLDEMADIPTCPLYKWLHDRVLKALRAGETVVINLALLEIFTSSFYRFLLQVRAAVLERNAQLIICGLRSEHWEIIELFQGFRIFRFAKTEMRAKRRTTLENQNICDRED